MKVAGFSTRYVPNTPENETKLLAFRRSVHGVFTPQMKTGNEKVAFCSFLAMQEARGAELLQIT